MIYLLDSDTLIFLVRGAKIIAPRTRSQRMFQEAAGRIRAHCMALQRSGEEIGLSVITVAELEFGARRSADYSSEIAAVNLILRPFTIFDFAAPECAWHYGELRERLERAGNPIGAMDLLIAAHARALKATLVTNNLSHLAQV